jgi:hypothetical protein
MTQQTLDLLVARSTGESPRTIHRLGFQLQGRPGDGLEPEDLRLAVDCPFCGRTSPIAPPVNVPGALAECDRCDVYFDYQPDEVYAAGPGVAPGGPVDHDDGVTAPRPGRGPGKQGGCPWTPGAEMR